LLPSRADRCEHHLANSYFIRGFVFKRLHTRGVKGLLVTVDLESSTGTVLFVPTSTYSYHVVCKRQHRSGGDPSKVSFVRIVVKRKCSKRAVHTSRDFHLEPPSQI